MVNPLIPYNVYLKDFVVQQIIYESFEIVTLQDSVCVIYVTRYTKGDCNVALYRSDLSNQ